MFITTKIAGQYDTPTGDFPLGIVAESGTELDESVQWIHANRDDLLESATKHGAVLFRGFGTDSDEAFDKCIEAFKLANFPYDESLSNAVRVNRTPRVFTANEAPSDVTIYLHHEMAQTPFFPRYLLFYCEIPAEHGGQTPVCRSDVLVDQLSGDIPSFIDDCESKGLLYTNVMPDTDDPESGMGRSWRSTFRVESRHAVEGRMTELGYSWEWLTDGSLQATTPVLPAIKELGDGRKSFFNQLIAAFQGWAVNGADPSTAITFGDGTRLNPVDVEIATKMAYDLVFDIPWQRGDFVLLDNRVCMHGRRGFVGKRSVLAALAVCETHGD